MTGDLYFNKTDPMPNVLCYEKNYSCHESLSISKLLSQNKEYGLGSYFNKRLTYTNIKNFPLPEVLALRITGKLRMNSSTSQKYYLPFINQQYIHYVNYLQQTKDNYHNRSYLMDICRSQHLLPKSILATKKSWLPSWVEYDKPTELLAYCLNSITQANSFVSSLFGDNYIETIEHEYQQKNYRFIFLLFYLELFHDNFIVHPERLICKSTFISQ